MAKEVLYKNIAALKPVENLVTEVNLAVTDGDRVASHNDDINAALGAAGGAGVGVGIGFAALYYAGITGLSGAGITSGLAALGIGGGMVAGIGVVAAPVALLAVGGYAVVANRNHKKLIEVKESLLQTILRKQAAIIDALNHTAKKNGERISYLTKLNTLLQAAIRDLQADLAGDD